ncbi:hypothetical protein PR202_ga11280 [Eleusine coracana subsp. coracana]|uniref:Uncharacterized protein n=1 Tax=Eleusine coracana subsp. coracana TaxID=191504 RepID=A0AAV5C951_ELECO|nr:hypothetical protein PR202_ga11280 [Eleusine coracana subsp. coracana]
MPPPELLVSPADAGVAPPTGRFGPLEEGAPDSAFQAGGASQRRHEGGAGFQEGLRRNRGATGFQQARRDVSGAGEWGRTG